MRGCDEIPQMQAVGLPQQAATECVGSCFFRTRSQLANSTHDDICHELQEYCESSALTDFCTAHGVDGASFTWNPHMQCHRSLRRIQLHHGKLYEQFWKAYENNPTLNLALAFHGTGEVNVPKILHYGLDPQFRRTQAFGKGEYFSKEPGLAATYRHEGHCLLVFLLLMPEDHERVYSQKDRDIIVVPELSHQLPLGVIRFNTVDNAKIQYSQEMRLSQRALKHAAVDADWRVTQAKLMAKLSELLHQGLHEQAAAELDVATRYHQLSHPYQRELVTLLRQCIPHAPTRDALFPELINVKPLHHTTFEDDHEDDKTQEDEATSSTGTSTSSNKKRTSITESVWKLVTLFRDSIPQVITRDGLSPAELTCDHDEKTEEDPAGTTSSSSSTSTSSYKNNIAELEEEAHEAWLAFLTMKMDPNRNIMPQDYQSSSSSSLNDDKSSLHTTCAQQLHQQHQMPGAMLLLDH